MDYKLIFADGTEIGCGMCGCAADNPDYLWVQVAVPLMQAVTLFADANKTEKLTYVTGEIRTEYERYTELRSMQALTEGTQVCLKRSDG